LRQVNQALALAEHRQLAVIREAARPDWQAAAWILARGFPQHWGRGRTIQGSQVDGNRVEPGVEE
jgi:hypothetical protein